MERDDGPPAPVLDYGTPPRAQPTLLNGPSERFTAGAAVPMLAILVTAAWSGEDMILCDAMGVAVALLLIGGSFHIGQRLCRRTRGRSLVERHWAITVGAGVLGAGMILGTLAAVDHVPKPLGGAFCLLSMFAVPAIAPWAVLRDEQ